MVLLGIGEEVRDLFRSAGAAVTALAMGDARRRRSRPFEVDLRLWRCHGFRRIVLISVVAMAPLVALACSPSSPDGGSVAARTTYPAPPSDPPSTKQAIIETYEGLWPAIRRAERAPADQRRDILSPYVAEPELGSLLDQIAKHRERGIVTYGREVIHVFDVEVDGRTAVLHDCQDNSGTGQMDEDTGEKLTRGLKEAHLVATLREVSEGEWRVKKINPVEEPCSAST